MKRRLCIFKVLVIFLFLHGLHSGFAKKSEPPTEYIDRIELGYRGIVFDGELSREQASNLTWEKPVIIEDVKDIDEFIYAIDTLKFTGGDYVSPFTDISTFFNPPKPNGVYLVPEIHGDHDGYATIFYTDGRLPSMIWFGHGSVEHGHKSYKMTYDLNRYLLALMRTMPKREAREIKVPKKLDISGIDKIVITQITQDNFKDGLPRRDFALSTQSISSVLTRSEINNPEAIRKIMSALQQLQYKETLYYDTTSPALVAHYKINGGLEWVYAADPVIGLIQIFRKSPKLVEMIWITCDYIERGYFKYYKDRYIQDVISEFISY